MDWFKALGRLPQSFPFPMLTLGCRTWHVGRTAVDTVGGWFHCRVLVMLSVVLQILVWDPGLCGYLWAVLLSLCPQGRRSTSERGSLLSHIWCCIHCTPEQNVSALGRTTARRKAKKKAAMKRRRLGPPKSLLARLLSLPNLLLQWKAPARCALAPCVVLMYLSA